MAFFDYLLTGLSALQGGLAERNQKQRTTGTSTTAFDPSAVPLRNQVLSKANSLLTEDPDLSGYEASQASALNHSSEVEKQKIIENLALRGIDPNSPAGAAAIDAAESRRFAGNTALHQSIPLTAMTLRQQNLNAANSVLNSQPRTTTADSDVNIGGNKLGGFITGLSQSLATLHGLGAFKKKSAGSSVNPVKLGGTPKFNAE